MYYIILYIVQIYLFTWSRDMYVYMQYIIYIVRYSYIYLWMHTERKQYWDCRGTIGDGNFPLVISMVFCKKLFALCKIWIRGWFILQDTLVPLWSSKYTSKPGLYGCFNLCSWSSSHYKSLTKERYICYYRKGRHHTCWKSGSVETDGHHTSSGQQAWEWGPRSYLLFVFRGPCHILNKNWNTAT